MFQNNILYSFRFLLYDKGSFAYNVFEMSLLKTKQITKWLTAFFAVSLLFFSYSSSLLADEELPSLIQESLTNNRDIKEATERLEAVRHRIPQASALPDPTAGTAYMGEMLETPLGPQKNIYEFEQMIPFPGKLVEKRQVAAAEKDAFEAQLNKTKRDVILKVSQIFSDLYATNKNLELLDEVLEILKKFEAVAQNRYASQSGSQRDVAKAQTEVSQTLERLFILRQQQSTQEAMLNALLNRNTQQKIEKLKLSPIVDITATVEELIDLAKKNRPELKEASAMLKKSEHEKTLSKYENMPDFSVGFQYTEIGNGTTNNIDDGRDAWMIPIKVTLPLWQNRIGSGIEEARRNFNATQARLEQTGNLTNYEVKDAYYRFTSSQKIVQLYENAFLPEAELAFHSDQAGYEAGKTDILNLIDSERVYLNSKMAYYQAQADNFKNFAALERAVGTDLSKKENVGEIK